MPLFGTPSRQPQNLVPKPGFKSDPFVSGDASDPSRPWYVRHRMRALLITALIPVAVGIVAFLAVWLTIQSGLKSHPVYSQVLDTLHASDAVRAELGDTLEPGFFNTGMTDKDAGTTEMMFSVRGQDASAGVRVFARRLENEAVADDAEDETWRVTFLDVGVKTDAGREKVITLIDEEKPQRFAEDAQD